ncbi:hypothetical protein SAMN05216330_112152 [Bradyrhizobium sp. Ghvi]|uniref:hypothetical protein n=1 Tax=Bradyrhizobium sp. Ghvi TaxID=1855319 RepID=UPI0008EBD25E|nr:hypothetical protein [Bradyrhizobium sp. Ghvi]SFP95072.1 hypothetical protein SAMN05216330_112152 [Bradyrhizobium sp. Ghvi]
MRPHTRADFAIAWVEKFCLSPSGDTRGQPVQLTVDEVNTMRRIYDNGERVPVSGRLAAFLALLHTAGPQAVAKDNSLPGDVTTDSFTVWNASGPRLRDVLERQGERVVCRELGTSYPPRAA